MPVWLSEQDSLAPGVGRRPAQLRVSGPRPVSGRWPARQPVRKAQRCRRPEPTRARQRIKGVTARPQNLPLADTARRRCVALERWRGVALNSNLQALPAAGLLPPSRRTQSLPAAATQPKAASAAAPVCEAASAVAATAAAWMGQVRRWFPVFQPQPHSCLSFLPGPVVPHCLITSSNLSQSPLLISVHHLIQSLPTSLQAPLVHTLLPPGPCPCDPVSGPAGPDRPAAPPARRTAAGAPSAAAPPCLGGPLIRRRRASNQKFVEGPCSACKNHAKVGAVG